jgi:hypothetical protein
LFVNTWVHSGVRDRRAPFQEFKQYFCDDLPTQARRRRMFDMPTGQDEPYHNYALFILPQMSLEFGFGLDEFNSASAGT